VPPYFGSRASARKATRCSGVPRMPTASPGSSRKPAPGFGITFSPRTTAKMEAPVSLLTSRSPIVRPRSALSAGPLPSGSVRSRLVVPGSLTHSTSIAREACRSLAKSPSSTTGAGVYPHSLFIPLLFLKSSQSAYSWEKANRPSVKRNRSFSSS
jgi:hypothetical protein